MGYKQAGSKTTLDVSCLFSLVSCNFQIRALNCLLKGLKHIPNNTCHKFHVNLSKTKAGLLLFGQLEADSLDSGMYHFLVMTQPRLGHIYIEQRLALLL